MLGADLIRRPRGATSSSSVRLMRVEMFTRCDGRTSLTLDLDLLLAQFLQGVGISQQLQKLVAGLLHAQRLVARLQGLLALAPVQLKVRPRLVLHILVVVLQCDVQGACICLFQVCAIKRPRDLQQGVVANNARVAPTHPPRYPSPLESPLDLESVMPMRLQQMLKGSQLRLSHGSGAWQLLPLLHMVATEGCKLGSDDL